MRWTFRCYPTAEQAVLLTRTFGCARYVYNWGLRLRSDGFRNGERIGYHESSAALTQLKKQPETAWLNEVSSVPLQQALRDLQTAFTNFFEKRTGYPAFRKKDGAQSVEYTTSGFRFDAKNRRLSIAKMGFLKVKWSRRVIPEPSSIRVIRKPSGAYFVSLVVDVEPKALPKTGDSVGIDFGVSRLATLSTGETVSNPKNGSRYARKLARAQRDLARKQKGSNRRKRAKVRVAKIHDKISACRKDALDKFSTSIVRRFDSIYIEDLNLRGMVKNHSLARSLNDTSIGQAIRMLETKAEMYGKTVQKIDRWFPSSKTCSKCGHIVSELPLSVRSWTCPDCGERHDRDVNAAVNILAVGQTVAAQGGTVRRPRAKALGRESRRTVNHPQPPGSGIHPL